MINPNICKRVNVYVSETITPQDDKKIKGLPVILWNRTLKPGKRRLYLKFSILNDGYYLSDRN